MFFHTKDSGVYTISITAEMLDCHPRTLRIYDEVGFIQPKRKNNIRYYSQEDIETLHKIMELMDKWNLNIYGVRALLEMAKRFAIDEEDMFRKMMK